MANFNRRVQGKHSKDTYQTNIMRGATSLSLFHRHWEGTPHRGPSSSLSSSWLFPESLNLWTPPPQHFSQGRRAKNKLENFKFKPQPQKTGCTCVPQAPHLGWQLSHCSTQKFVFCAGDDGSTREKYRIESGCKLNHSRNKINNLKNL